MSVTLPIIEHDPGNAGDMNIAIDRESTAQPVDATMDSLAGWHRLPSPWWQRLLQDRVAVADGMLRVTAAIASKSGSAAWS